MSGSQFKKILDTQREFYKTLEPVFSNVIQSNVHFTAPGFNHLRFKIDNTPRTPVEAMYKLKLLTYVPLVIKEANTIDTYLKRLSPVGGSRKKVYKEVEYWSLVASVIENKYKIRVILRKVAGSDQICFWSVMKLQSNKKPHLTDEVA